MIRQIPRRRTALVASWLALAALFLAAPRGALAHARLLRSEPGANSNLTRPPKAVELWFNEELEPGLTTVEVKDARGQRVDKGEVTLAEGNKKARAELGELGSGTYTVEWKAVSEDEHTIRGRFTFTLQVTGETATAPTPAQTAASQTPARPGMQHAPPSQGDASRQSAAWAEDLSPTRTVVRWLSYLAMMVLFGGFAFRLFVLVPALARAAGGAERGEAVLAGERRLLSLGLAGAALLALTTLAALVTQSSSVFDRPPAEALSPTLLMRVLTETGYGASWLLQAGSLVAVAVILLLLHKRAGRGAAGGRSALWWAGLAAGAALLAAPSLTGHAAAAARHFRLSVFSDWLHLLAGGFWAGGLFHLALTWPAAHARLDARRRARSLPEVVRLFTRVAAPGVALLFVTGLYNTWAHVPGPRALWLTPYGGALGLKLLLVLLMLLLGGLNNFHYGRKAALAASAEGGGAAEQAGTGRSLFRSVALEACLGVLVLLVTAVLVFMTPARNHPAMDRADAAGEFIQGQR